MRVSSPPVAEPSPSIGHHRRAGSKQQACKQHREAIFTQRGSGVSGTAPDKNPANKRKAIGSAPPRRCCLVSARTAVRRGGGMLAVASIWALLTGLALAST